MSLYTSPSYSSTGWVQSKSLISDKDICFFLISIQFYVKQPPMVAVNLDIQSTQKWTISLRPSND